MACCCVFYLYSINKTITHAAVATAFVSPLAHSDSWIEMYASDRSGNNSGTLTPTDRHTPLPFSNGGGEEYLRLLREAARESKESSRVVSLAGSRRDSPRSSPKSPPNSPNNELATDDDFKDIFINYYNTIKETVPGSGKGTWDWNSRPDQCPPK